jgi:hypothetical protein
MYPSIADAASWPAAAFWLEAEAVARNARFGGGGGGCTVTVAVPGSLGSSPSVTTSWNASSWAIGATGATKVGFGAVALDSDTAGPSVCVHA